MRYDTDYEAIVEVNTCGNIVYYEWEQLFGPPADLTDTQRFSPNLILLEFQLLPLETYIFRLNGLANVTIYATIPDPVALPSHGKQIGPNSILEISDFFTSLASVPYAAQYNISDFSSMANSTLFDIDVLLPMEMYHHFQIFHAKM